MESVHDKNIKPEDQRVAFCMCCRAKTFQTLKLWNPEDPEAGEVWVCSQCTEAIEFN